LIIIFEGILDLLHSGLIFVIILLFVQYFLENSSVLAHSLTGSCHFGFVGSKDCNFTNETVFIAEIGVFSVTIQLHNEST
jgi:hypothetical protein